MELRQLEMFLEAADRRSITAAAQALYVAQPSVSAAIASLERELGVPLFDRLPRGVRVVVRGMSRMVTACLWSIWIPPCRPARLGVGCPALGPPLR